MNEFLNDYISEMKRKMDIVSTKEYLDTLISILDSHKIDVIDDAPYEDEFSEEEKNAKELLSTFSKFIENSGGIVEDEVSQTSFPEFYIVFKYNDKVYVIDTIVGQGAVTTLLQTEDPKYIPSVTLFPEDNVKVRVEDELIQYIIINKDLNMSPGKTAAQAGHACTVCAVENHDNAQFQNWYRGAQKKIVLGAHQKVLENFEKEGYIAIHDMGLTEIPSNSLTAISLGVMRKSTARPLVKKLQLLK